MLVEVQANLGSRVAHTNYESARPPVRCAVAVTRRVQHRAPELLEAGERWHVRRALLTRRDDQRGRAPHAPILCGHVPTLTDAPHGNHCCAQVQMWAEQPRVPGIVVGQVVGRHVRWEVVGEGEEGQRAAVAVGVQVQPVVARAPR